MAKKAKSTIQRAFELETKNISTLAKELKDDDGNFDSGKIKQLRDLTVAAKELAALMKMSDGTEEDNNRLSVVFTEEGDEWAN